ncbi:hypothetical protein ACVW1A_004123 [Bradyrhizobium sp. LB1.3]
MSGQCAEQRGLAAAGGTEDADELARRDGKVETTHRLERIAAFAERDRDISNVDATDALRVDIRDPNVHRATPFIV